MATLDEVRAYLAVTKSANIKPSEMVALIDYAIATSLTDGQGKFVVQAQDDDTLLRVDTIEDLQKAAAFYRSIGDTGGVINKPLEMQGW